MGIETILDVQLDQFAFSPLPVPPRAGVGLKGDHVDDILSQNTDIGFFEVHAENYMGAGGFPHHQLSSIRQNYPLSLHGVGMSIGGEAPLDSQHLKRFAALVDYYKPGLVSEHLAWSTHNDIFYNDLLPVPYTAATLARIVDHVKQVQDTIGRQILIENPSTYIAFSQSTISETDFMAMIAKQAQCGLLFDVNNVFISATNHGYSPVGYIDAYPLELVGEIHLAGHSTDRDDDDNPLLIDAHDREVCTNVWALYRHVLKKTGPLPSLVEWDNDVPQWPVLAKQGEKAQAILDEFGVQSKSIEPKTRVLDGV